MTNFEQFKDQTDSVVDKANNSIASEEETLDWAQKAYLRLKKQQDEKKAQAQIENTIQV